jgi:Uma2 family endonuclease
MAMLTFPVTLSTGEIVATGVSRDEYLAQYAADRHEWTQGVVIKMSPESMRHMLLIDYLSVLLKAYFELNPIGITARASFVLRLDMIETCREPDLQVILNDNPGTLTDTAMIGAADICVEVVSPESVARDYGHKFADYEKAGVREYWIIDPLRQDGRFHRLQESGLYARLDPNASGHYRTPLLPRLALHVPTLWQETLPGISATVRAVQQMFEA